jgi:hypothetical protein
MTKVGDWRVFEFLKEDNGHFSSTRLFAFSIIASAIVDWQRAVWVGGGIWHPDFATVGLIAGVLGVKVLQKGLETKTGIDQITKIQKTIDLSGKETPVTENPVVETKTEG